MFISIPKECLESVFLSEKFKENIDSDNMEYEIKGDFRGSNLDECQIEELEDEINRKKHKNSEDEEDVDKFTEIFLTHIKKVQSLKITEVEVKEKLNIYAENIKKIYEEPVKKLCGLPNVLKQSDIDGLVNLYTDKLGELFKEYLKLSKVKEKELEKSICEYKENVNELVKKHIKKINVTILNKKNEPLTQQEIENKFKNYNNMYEFIDNEYIEESVEIEVENQPNINMK